MHSTRYILGKLDNLRWAAGRNLYEACILQILRKPKKERRPQKKEGQFSQTVSSRLNRDGRDHRIIWVHLLWWLLARGVALTRGDIHRLLSGHALHADIIRWHGGGGGGGRGWHFRPSLRLTVETQSDEWARQLVRPL